MLFTIIVAACFVVATRAEAQCYNDFCGGDSVDVDVNLDVASQMSVTDDSQVNTSFDSKSIALVNTLGDVDIRECLGSTQWGTPIFSKQKLVIRVEWGIVSKRPKY